MSTIDKMKWVQSICNETDNTKRKNLEEQFLDLMKNE